jgi:hypothetical protein
MEDTYKQRRRVDSTAAGWASLTRFYAKSCTRDNSKGGVQSRTPQRPSPCRCAAGTLCEALKQNTVQVSFGTHSVSDVDMHIVWQRRGDKLRAIYDTSQGTTSFIWSNIKSFDIVATVISVSSLRQFAILFDAKFCHAQLESAPISQSMPTLCYSAPSIICSGEQDPPEQLPLYLLDCSACWRAMSSL